ncbi:coagulation factor IX-like [Ochlerotatus camptorhynchus]|uniref:coagulation factor IX-like n=1 Tax=Ochlerotatus camptorhynchus TaxID=644619 RepID=UPI0031DE0F5F
MFFKSALFLTCLTAISCSKQARIFGGQQKVEPGEFPNNALIHIRQPLQTTLKSFCGSILSEKLILVAAHSTYSDLAHPERFEVIAGKYDLLQWSSTEQVRKVRIVIKHPDYDHFVKGMHDVAVLVLTRSLDFNVFIQPVALMDSLDYPTGVGMVTGYGVIEPSGTKASYLTKLSVNILTQAACTNGDSLWNPTLFCSDPGTCDGDSGAPLFQRHGDKWVQIGLVSFGSQCAFYGSPTYYTFLGRYLNWINETMVSIKDNDGNGTDRPNIAGAPLVGIIAVTCSKIIIGLLTF